MFNYTNILRYTYKSVLGKYTNIVVYTNTNYKKTNIGIY